MGREGGPSSEEMGLKPEETRILSDAELIKGGARVKEGGRLEVTGRQVQDAHKEMTKALFEKDLKLAKEKADQARQQGEGAEQDPTRDKDFGRFYEELQKQIRSFHTGTSGNVRQIAFDTRWNIAGDVSFDEVAKFIKQYEKFFGADAATLNVVLTELRRKHAAKEDVGAWATSRESREIHSILRRTFETFQDSIAKRKAAA